MKYGREYKTGLIHFMLTFNFGSKRFSVKEIDMFSYLILIFNCFALLYYIDLLKCFGKNL